MSLHSYALISSVPADTVGVSHAAFRAGTAYLILHDQLGSIFTDANFVDLFR